MVVVIIMMMIIMMVVAGGSRRPSPCLTPTTTTTTTAPRHHTIMLPVLLLACLLLAWLLQSLNEYLDMKKKIFPRFYFVSNVALLDILSNGNNPPKVTSYLGDCYDSIADLVFEPPVEAGAVPNVASRMIAKDGEQVSFYKPFVIAGAVETWLNDLTVMQQNSLRCVVVGRGGGRGRGALVALFAPPHANMSPSQSS